MGVRLFDLRICDDAGDGDVWISHYFVTSYTLRNILGTFSDFLAARPTEFLVVKLISNYGRCLNDKQAVADMVASFGFRFPPYEPHGLDTKISSLAGGIIFSSRTVPNVCPVKCRWPTNLFEGASLSTQWRWRNATQAMERTHEFVMSEQHMVTSKGQLSGVVLDGSFTWPPSGWFAANTNAWFLNNVRTEWAPHVSARLGVVVTDYITPEFCAEIIGRAMDQARRPAESRCGKSGMRESWDAEDRLVLPSAPAEGICHVGSSCGQNVKTCVIATRSSLREGCQLTAAAYENPHADTYEFHCVVLGPHRFELTVRRTDEDAGWGQDLHVRWSAAPTVVAGECPGDESVE